MKKLITRWVTVFLVIFLPVFSFGIFGPTEVFFANYHTFGVLFSDFGVWFLVMGIGATLLLSFVIVLLPERVRNIFLLTLWAISIAGYIQTMFLNRNIDQIGATSEGYQPELRTILLNAGIWIIILLAAVGICWIAKKHAQKIVVLSSCALILMQAVAYVFLIVTAEEDAFHYEEGEIALDGSQQYEVSPNKNVIVFVLDNISNVAYAYSRLTYPEMDTIMKDFTYYTNADSNYYGTFPSLCHIMTGYEYDPSVTVNQWTYDAWKNEDTTSFYEKLHESNYQVHVYTNLEESQLLVGTNGVQMLGGEVDNLLETTSEVDVNHRMLWQSLLQMSAYRFMPEVLKPQFDIPNSQYANLVTYKDNVVNAVNPLYYSDLTAKGLTRSDTEDNYLIFQYLNGIHELINDENCELVSVDDYQQTMAGIWKLLDEYFNQLKECGVYDDATIIVTSDHGTQFYGQNIFFIKKAGEVNDALQESNAPITLQELLPTLAQETGIYEESMGKTIWDYSENEARTRTLGMRYEDATRANVPRFDGVTTSTYNTFQVYTYTGNLDCYWEQYYAEKYELIPVKDSFY
jgi:hypothetical protein